MAAPKSNLISTMSATQMRAILSPEIGDEQAERVVAVLLAAEQDDDLDLAEGPLDVISDALVLPLANAYRDGVRPGADDLAIEVYEALIDANLLPGINARRHCTDAIDSESDAD